MRPAPRAHPRGVVALAALCALAGLVPSACGSTSGGAAQAADAAPVREPEGAAGDAAGDDAGDATSGPDYDGTTGKRCATDADCDLTGRGLARCSADAFAVGPVMPTPVCLLDRCDPTSPDDPSGAQVHFCDGPDDPSSPGLCVATDSPPQPARGVCYPKCTYSDGGGRPQGCAGANACAPRWFTVDGDGGALGVGICFGGCVADSDCPTGSKCQVDQAVCVTAVAARTKKSGDACTAADLQGGACNCLLGAGGSGYCAAACIVGAPDASTPSACPAGMTCDANAPPGVSLADGGSGPGFASQNPGLLGTCMTTCAVVDASAGCPPNSTCASDSIVGPDCRP